MLTCEILSVTLSDDDDTIVRYSCYDGEETAQIAFIDNVSVPAACFHSERVADSRAFDDAFSQMCRHIDFKGTNAAVGSVFVSG